jgi:hypothetical protein
MILMLRKTALTELNEDRPTLCSLLFAITSAMTSALDFFLAYGT